MKNLPTMLCLYLFSLEMLLNLNVIILSMLRLYHEHSIFTMRRVLLILEDRYHQENRRIYIRPLLISVSIHQIDWISGEIRSNGDEKLFL